MTDRTGPKTSSQASALVRGTGPNKVGLTKILQGLQRDQSALGQNSYPFSAGVIDEFLDTGFCFAVMIGPQVCFISGEPTVTFAKASASL